MSDRGRFNFILKYGSPEHIRAAYKDIPEGHKPLAHADMLTMRVDSESAFTGAGVKYKPKCRLPSDLVGEIHHGAKTQGVKMDAIIHPDIPDHIHNSAMTSDDWRYKLAALKNPKTTKEQALASMHHEAEKGINASVGVIQRAHHIVYGHAKLDLSNDPVLIKHGFAR